jgi:hypothetical protein
MKKIEIKKVLKAIRAILLLLYLISLDVNIFSQPDLPSGHGENGDQGAGGMAPLGEGLIFFLIGAGIYGIRKIISKRKGEGK